MRLKSFYLLLCLLLLPVIVLAQEATETPSEVGGLPRSETGQFLYNERGNLFVINGDGSGAQSLTLNNSSEQCPTWMPDGNRIAFVGVISGQSLHRLYMMNADGSDVMQLSTAGLSRQTTYALHPSADGSEIIWQTQAIGESQRFHYAVDVETGDMREIDVLEVSRLLSPNGLGIDSSRDGVYTVDAEGSETHILEIGELPEWSPDGERIAVIIGHDDPLNFLQGIAIANSDGSAYTTLLEPNYIIDSFAWSPDGSQIGLIITHPDDAQEDYIFYLATLDTTTGELVYRSEGASLPSALRWSADSTRIAYHNSNVLGDQLDWYFVDLVSENSIYFATNISECDTVAWRP